MLNPRTCKPASRVRSLNCVAPETTSKLVPGAPEECALRRFARRVRWRRRGANSAENRLLRFRPVDGLALISPIAGNAYF
eukprot:5550228-Alexandrium_andersonii.AAC.1